MPPARKKSRLFSTSAAGAAGPDEAAVPVSMNLVSPLQRDVSHCVELMQLGSIPSLSSGGSVELFKFSRTKLEYFLLDSSA